MFSVRQRLMDILMNHSTEEDIIRMQLDQEKEHLDRELERIYSSLGVKGINYDTIKVQSSKNADAALVNALAACDRARDKYAIATRRLQEELNQIHAVYDQVLLLGGMEKNVLLALYYPRRSAIDACRILYCGRTTLYRWKADAIDRLYDICLQKKII